MTMTDLDEPVRNTGIDQLSRRDFQRLADFIEGYSGIKMPPTKITMVEGRLRRRVRETGAGSLAKYCHRLFDEGELEAEAIHLIDAVTTNKTEFFREAEHFRYLAETALPALFRDRPGAAGVKLWSAACSTGAEPYTLAMVLAEFLQHGGPKARVSIVGTDLSTEVLHVAAQGIYPENAVMSVPAELRRRYLLRSRNPSHGLVRIVPGLRGWMQFGRLNFMAAEYPLPRDFDVIFCRNVLIYFDKPTQHAVLTRLAQHLRPGGYLFLGHSESAAGMRLPLTVVGNTIFRRVVK
jgi:chemotaxis protein methyltransferase CheR